MSDVKPDRAFWDAADAFIEQANQCCDSRNAGIVSEALLYAAARFASFLVAVNSETRKDFREDKNAARQYLLAQFEKMLADNLDDYDENFKVYTRDET